MAKIELKNLTKNFGDVKAVNNLSVSIDDGKFLAFLGPSGCGKTTSLRIIAGLEYPDSGNIYFDNKDLTNALPADRNISMAFENYALFPHMTVFENVRYPLKVQAQKLSKDDMNKKVLEALKLVNIVELQNRFPKQLSGGQQQRVSIARAIVKRTSLYLYDEPLSHLDAKLRERMRGELKRLQRDLGITTIFVTHDQIEALSMADKIVVMNFGVGQQIGTPDELYFKPVNLFVSSFIGSPEMNFLNCNLQKETDSYYLIGYQLKLQISKQLAVKMENIKNENNFVVGFRPNDIIIHPANVNLDYPLMGTVFICEPLGIEQVIKVKVGEILIQVVAPHDLKINIDETVKIEIPENKYFVYDKKSGLNIL